MFPIRGRLSDPITTFREKSGSLSSIKSGKFSSSKKDLVRETAQTAYQSIKERALMQGSGSVSGSPGRIQENLSRDSGIGGLKEGLNTSGESEHEIPKYISDVTDMSNYVRGRFLGKGGFARVHELIDLQTNSLFAGKIINKSRISKPHHKEKITREIELHRNLIHKNVVQFVKNFEDSDNIYIVLENCSKRSLVHVLKARHVVTEIETRYYMQQLVNGVQYIHSQNIIHRDLKLGNLFLTGTMAVKIGDFGLATRVGWEKKGTICGTPNYISPEVLNKDGHGFPADVWALGCVMYALLVGQPPFETSTLKETYTRIAENVYSIPEAVSPLAASFIRQLLHPDPKQRPLVPNIAQDPFFTCGFCPVSLPPSACSVTPLLAPPVYNNKTDSSPIPGGYQTGLASRLSASTTNLDSKRLQSPKISSKDSMFPGMCESVATTVFSKLYKPDIQTLTNRNNSPKARTRTEELHLAVKTALSSMPSSRQTDPPAATLKEPPTFIAKWIDYSNKYGFGFQLSDKSIGILFNDNTRISYSSDRSFIQFGENQEVTTMGTHQVPPYLHEKFTLLRYFAQYMDQNLTEGGETRKGLRSLTTTIPQIKRWIRTPKAIIMHLTNGTIQVNYFKDHTKLIIGSLDEAVTSPPQQQQQNCLPNQASQLPFIVTYINSARESRCFHLNDLARHGASQPVRERMSYVAEVLNEFVELDKQIS